jgi:hypothetical protein
MPRLFRESPLNSIWEGSGNVQCLDVLRADAFCATRLGGDGGLAFGTLPASAATGAILARALPQLA